MHQGKIIPVSWSDLPQMAKWNIAKTLGFVKEYVNQLTYAVNSENNKCVCFVCSFFFTASGIIGYTSLGFDIQIYSVCIFYLQLIPAD